MILKEGEVITLNTNGKDYVVLKKVNYNNTNYYYLMTLDKPTEVLVVKISVNSNNEPIIITVTDKKELETLMKITSEQGD